MTEPARKPKLILRDPEPRRRPSGVMPRTALPGIDLRWIAQLHRLWRRADRVRLSRR